LWRYKEEEDNELGEPEGENGPVKTQASENVDAPIL
jgi:hypothetical protein